MTPQMIIRQEENKLCSFGESAHLEGYARVPLFYSLIKTKKIRSMRQSLPQ
jgi:hypothetical protein